MPILLSLASGFDKERVFVFLSLLSSLLEQASKNRDYCRFFPTSKLFSIRIIFGTYGMYTYGMYTYDMYTYGMYTYGMYTYGMYTYGMYTYIPIVCIPKVCILMVFFVEFFRRIFSLNLFDEFYQRIFLTNFIDEFFVDFF